MPKSPTPNQQAELVSIAGQSGLTGDEIVANQLLATQDRQDHEQRVLAVWEENQAEKTEQRKVRQAEVERQRVLTKQVRVLERQQRRHANALAEHTAETVGYQSLLDQLGDASNTSNTSNTSRERRRLARGLLLSQRRVAEREKHLGNVFRALDQLTNGQEIGSD